MIGQTISHYKILEKLGEGGMGIVYKAEDTKLKRTVALKFLPPELTRDQEAKKRFLHEARAASALDHPNICNIFEINETADGQMFIAMAYYDGETLKEKIASRPLPLVEAIDIATQIAEGLSKAHQKDIVHRDIKSANIIITDESVAKILDFGLAKLRGATKLTKEGTTLGTVAYMSPEQASGDKVDHRSDIWSLGVLLYEMITGQLPFKGEYEQAIMYAIMNEEPEPITGLRTGIPMEMERIINKILAKEPAERYQGTVDLMVDLKKIKSDSNSKTPIIKQKTKPEKTLQISRKSLTTAATLLLGIIVLLIVYFLFIGKTEPETPSITPTDKPSLAVLRFKNHTGEKNLDHWRSGFPELLIIDLSQSKFMQVLRSEQMSGIIRKLNLVEEKDYSEEQLYQIASQGKIDHILSGSYLKAGNQYVITAMLQNMASGEVISTGKFRADGEEEIFAQIDKLSREIKTKLNFSQQQISRDIDEEIGKITTSSPKAYKFFIKGMEEYRHSGTFRAIQYFRKAIDIDPEFAMAYRFLAINYNNIGKEEEYIKNIRKAFEKYNRLSVRERYLIQGDFYRLNEKNHGKAIDAYKKLLEFYPDDNATNRTLGYLYFLYEKFEKALKFWEKNLTSKFSVSNDYYNIMELYMIKGRDEEVKKLAAYYLENISEDYAIRLVLARLYITRGNFKKALTECEKLSLIRPEAPGYYRQKGYIYLLKDDWTKAKDIFLYLADREDDRAIYFGRGGLATLYLTLGQNRLCQAQLRQAITQAEKSGMTSRMLWLNRRLISLYNKSGKRQRALEECNKAYGIAVKKESLREEKRLMLLKGIILLNLGSTNSAKKMAEQLKEVILNGLNKKEIRLYHLLTGLVNLKQENLQEAIKSLKDACGLLPRDVYFSPFLMGYNHAMFLDPLAFAYLKAGQLNDARDTYQKIFKLTLGRLFHGDIYAKAFYQLGKIYQQQGMKEKAIEHYRTFIELWENCDPPLKAMVEDARKRVRELEGSK